MRTPVGIEMHGRQAPQKTSGEGRLSGGDAPRDSERWHLQPLLGQERHFLQRHFRSRERLHDFLLLILRARRIAIWPHETRGDEHHEVCLRALIDTGTEEPAEDRDVSEKRDFVFHLLNVFTHQSAEHDGRSIEDTHAGGHLPRAEDRLVDDVRSDDVDGLDSR